MPPLVLANPFVVVMYPTRQAQSLLLHWTDVFQTDAALHMFGTHRKRSQEPPWPFAVYVNLS